ncbi:unnamed protein product [Microthlaspi erraticum]|uniref:Uncharacterized protein n=1 Tax=Microthlaspi erraticum TaxID=1685480 RepID=A0A6D2JI83_9BRAS|nr:unnamed protein product [Microthlaspi erraticum]
METPRSKPSPPPPSRVSKPTGTKSDGSSPSPVHGTRLSLDRSPQSVNSKPSPDRRTARVPTPPEASSKNKLHPFDDNLLFYSSSFCFPFWHFRNPTAMKQESS